MVSIIQYYTKTIKLQCSIALFLFPFITANAVTAKFERTIENKCSPVTVTFKNLSSTEAGTQYLWNFGKGSSFYSSKMTLQEIYTQPGIYHISLIAIHGTEKDSASTTIEVFKGPEALFSSEKTIGCAPFTVNLTNKSIPGSVGIKEAFWDFRNGTTMTGELVQYTFISSGGFDILLNVTDSNGCSNTLELTNYFKVLKKPVADFTASDTFACSAPLNVTFINKSSGASPLKYNWNFGNGIKSSEINSSTVYSRNDSFTVKLKITDTNGCLDSITKDDFIKVGKNNYGRMYTLVNGQESFLSSVCPGTVTFGYEIKNQPDYHYEVNYKDSVRHFYTREFSLKIDKASTITIKLWYGSKTTCPDTAVFHFSVNDVKADFSVDNLYGCSYPHNVHLTNLSKNSIKYSWYVNNNLLSNEKNIDHTFNESTSKINIYNHYANIKEYNVTLIAESETGYCLDSVSKKVVVSLPVARFMPDTVSGCIPLKVVLSDSSYSDNEIKKWVYRIGSDSIVCTAKAPVEYVFNKPGSFNTSLIITDNLGCVDTSYNVIIEAGSKIIPVFSVSKYLNCYGDTLHLNGSPDSTGLSFKWRYSSSGIFNSGFVNSPDVKIILKPDSSGSKSIKLEVENYGCFSSVVKNNIFSVNGPLGNFIKKFDCNAPLGYTFISNIKPATSLNWTIDTLIVNDEDTVKYTFPQPGTYNISLIAEDLVSGCRLTKSSNIKVRKVKADFTVKPFYCLGELTDLLAGTSQDYISQCYNEGFLWAFNDNTPPRRTSNPDFTHLYSSKNTFRPLLTVTADNGCTDTISRLVRILKPEPVFTTSRDSGCGPEMKVIFTNTSTDTTIDNWIWFFGDGGVDITFPKTPNHTYFAQNMIFNPVLKAIDFYGCSANYIKPLIITTPDAGFQALDNAICLGDEVVFQKAETNPDKFSWSFGDNTNSQTSDNHLYKKSGKYDVKLTVIKNGCTDTLTRSSYISVEKANASYSVDDSIADCYPKRITFRLIDANNYVQRIWSFGTGTTSTNNDDIARYTYSKPGKYNTSLIVKSLNGCMDKKSKLITINGPSANFSFSPKNICYGDSVVFSIDSLKDVDSYTLYYGDGEIGQTNGTRHYYQSRGIITPTLKIENKNCSVTIDAGIVNVSRLQAAFDFINKKNFFCEYNPISVINRSTYNTQSTWKINDSILSTERTLVNYTLKTPGNYRLKLEVADNNSCFDTISKPMSIIKKPDFNIVGKTVICRDIDTALLTINAQNTWTITWVPENGLSNPNSFRVFASPDTTTTYVAFVTDTAKCINFDTIRIAVNQPYNIISFPDKDTTINIGEPAYLTVLSDKENVSYWWSPGYKISCRTCNNPIVVPYNDYTYTVKTKDDCFERDKSINIKVVKNFLLEAPEAFSPNNDGHNDVFHFENENIKVFNLKIFNRWGSIVFETDNINLGWDGTSNGKKQNTDTYSYIIKAETVSGYKFEKKGTVILLK